MPVEVHPTEHGTQIGNAEFIWALNSKEFFFSNSILIQDPHTTLVDPSANFSYLEQIASQKIVTQVFNTHYHIDHRSLNSLFPHARFMAHEKDAEVIRHFENYLRCADTLGSSVYINWLREVFSSLDILERYISTTLKDGDLLPLTNNRVRVIHLPGHTPGHCGLMFEDINLFYVSDMDLTPLGPWYANITSNIDDFLTSIEKLKKTSCDYYITSHGNRIYEPEVFFKKLEKFESAFEKRDQLILEQLAKSPSNLVDLSQVGIIYKSCQLLQDPLKASFERQMLEKHLVRLAKKGLVQRDGDRWLAV